jgi:hypothetical protein
MYSKEALPLVKIQEAPPPKNGKRRRGAADRRVPQSRSVSLEKDTKDTFAQRLAEKSRGFQIDFA